MINSDALGHEQIDVNMKPVGEFSYGGGISVEQRNNVSLTEGRGDLNKRNSKFLDSNR